MAIVSRAAQMKIQQMAFMLVGLFFFFTLVGLFFLNFTFNDLDKKAGDLALAQATSSLRVIANMPELACGSNQDLCLDEDRLKVFSGIIGDAYDSFWPVASIRVFRVYPASSGPVKCPAANCNYYDVFDSGQTSKQEYATFVSLCKQVNDRNYVYDRCEVAKLLVGVVDG